MYLVYFLTFTLLFSGKNTDAVDIDQAFFLDGACSREMEPLHSLTVKFSDREDLEDGEYHIPSKDVDCNITFYRNEYTDSLTRKISVKARNDYSVENPFTCGTSGISSDCITSNAYIQVYYGAQEDHPNVLIDTYCGATPIGYMETPAGYMSVTIRLVIKASDVTTPSSVANETLSTGDVLTTEHIDNSSTLTFTGVSSTQLFVDDLTTRGVNTSTTDPTISTCGTNFTIDITSFIVGNCHQDGRRNNKEQWYCRDEDKCISKALVCDGFLADNCGNYADNYAGKPANCGVKPVSLLWLWILLAILCALILLYWCCWRPGWLVWRLGCLRNCCHNTCCHSCATSCNKGCCQPCKSAAANGEPLCEGQKASGRSQKKQRQLKNSAAVTESRRKHQKAGAKDANQRTGRGLCACCKPSKGKLKCCTHVS
ncbi:uncharacterized protein [Watersipora subatra]|uniref:uncharacterized protein n=1 Tax=Watersipora subatra TaxID=2589382 RepID=UPI00355B0957